MKIFKIFIPLFIISLFTINALQGQTRFIPRAGLNLSYFAGDLDNPDDEVRGELGYQAGASVRFGEAFYFEPGIQYFERNALLERTGGVDVTDLEVEFKLKGLRVPVYIGGDLFTSERFGVRIYGGPTAIFLFNNDDEFSALREYVLKDNLWSLNAGAGIDLGILTVDLEHEWGVSDVFDIEGASSRNNVFYVSVGLLF